METPHIHTCPVCDRDHRCYGLGCTKIDSLCDECSDADDDEEDTDDVEDSADESDERNYISEVWSAR